MHTKDLWFGIEREALSIVKQGRESKRIGDDSKGKGGRKGKRKRTSGREEKRERVREGEVEECREEEWSCKDNIRWGMEN